MPTDETIETIEDAIESVAKGMIQEASESGRSQKNIVIDDLITAANWKSGQVAASKPGFGLRITKCVPPGGG